MTACATCLSLSKLIHPWDFTSPTSRRGTFYYYVRNQLFFTSAFFGLSSAGLFSRSIAGHGRGPREHWMHVWALAEVRGTCSWGSTSRKLVNNHGIAFRPARADQAHTNPKNKARFPPLVIFSFSSVAAAATVQQPRLIFFFPFVTATIGGSECGVVRMRECARGVNRVILLSANLYTRTWLTMASSGTYTAVRAV